MEHPINEPVISVIVATYNSPVTLRYALESLLMQNFKNFEVWIIGDGCTDHSEAVVKEFNETRFNWINLSVNSGSQAEPNNEGLKRAKGKYIAFLGHDDLWFPHHLQAHLHHLESSHSDFTFCLTAFIKPSGVYSAGGPPSVSRGFENWLTPPSSWFFKKNIVDECGYWGNPETLGKGVDEDYMHKILKSGKIISFTPGLLILKFPAFQWGLYSMENNFPQVEYIKMIRENPSKTEREILLQLVEASIARPEDYYLDPPSFKKSIYNVLRAMYFLFLNFYSRERWPVKQFRAYRHRIKRKKGKISRGLKE